MCGNIPMAGHVAPGNGEKVPMALMVPTLPKALVVPMAHMAPTVPMVPTVTTFSALHLLYIAVGGYSAP